MVLISWNNDLSVNIVEVDRQHQKLIRIINELHDAMRARKTVEVLGKIINDLVDYTVIHFSFEEKYFAQFKYPRTLSHKKEHKYFINKINEFKKGFDSGRILMSMDIMNFLKEWLIKHIQGTDKQYVSLFHENGVK